ALLERASQEIMERLQGAIARSSSPRQQLVEVVQEIMRYFDEQPHLFDLIQHAEVMQKPDTEFPWQKIRNRTQELVREIFARGTRAGVFRVADPDLGVLMLLGGLRAVMRFGPRPRPEGLAELVVTTFLEGAGSASSQGTQRSRA